jgi:hypothetical protein
MADYTATARTNYFLVKDVEALKAELRTYGIEPATWAENQRGADFVLDDGPKNKPAGAIALFSFGTWPQMDEDSVAMRLDIEDEETPVPGAYVDLTGLIANHLVEGQVAVFIEIGFEKMTYLAGGATAVNAAGETRSIDLEGIYAVAKELTTDEHPITIAQY